MKILQAIDYDELEAAGVFKIGGYNDWKRFCRNPFVWLIRAEEEIAQKVWGIIETRMKTEMDNLDKRTIAECRKRLDIPGEYSDDAIFNLSKHTFSFSCARVSLALNDLLTVLKEVYGND
uniref:Uncharacterized protein n=1 Tax=viral metagenome TaxID=1070528 RepID=A0A6M3L9V4_9ZZZZ